MTQKSNRVASAKNATEQTTSSSSRVQNYERDVGIQSKHSVFSTYTDLYTIKN